MRKLSAAIVCALFCACGGSSSSSSDAGPADAGDPVKVFGLDVGDCFEFSNGDTLLSPASLGVNTEDAATSSIWYLPDGGSSTVNARTLVFRQTGQVRMTDYLYVDGKDVLLLKRDVAEAEEIEFHPAIVVARVPLKNADHLDEDGGVRVFGGDGGDDLQPFGFTFDVAAQNIVTPYFPGDGGNAFTYEYSGGASRLSSWSIVPGTGTIALSLQLPGDQGTPNYELQNVRQLSAGDQSCGAALTP